MKHPSPVDPKQQEARNNKFNMNDDINNLMIISQLAEENWLAKNKEDNIVYNSELVSKLYELCKTSVAHAQRLEVLHYLEDYLWPNVKNHHLEDGIENHHCLSIVYLVNEKFRQGQTNVWGSCPSDTQFNIFFKALLRLKMMEESASIVDLSIPEQTQIIYFLINCFQSLEVDMVRNQVLRLVALPLWNNLNPNRLNLELNKHSDVKRIWKRLKKREKRGNVDLYPASFIPYLFAEFFTILHAITKSMGADVVSDHMVYCERFIELIVDLLSQIPTRRYFLAYVEDSHIYARCLLSNLCARTEAKRFAELLELLQYYIGFEVNEQTGLELSEKDMITIHTNKLLFLQKICFKYFPKLRQFALSNIARIEFREALEHHFSKLDEEELRELCEKLSLLGPRDETSNESKHFLLTILTSHYEKRPLLASRLNKTPLFPNEKMIWNESIVPDQSFSNQHSLAIPKLNLQFLTFPDYFLRNLRLYGLENTFQVRQLLNSVIPQMNGRFNSVTQKTQFQGWSNTAIPVTEVKVTKVESPKIGEEYPSHVEAIVKVNLDKMYRKSQFEWKKLKKGDILLLVSIQSPLKLNDEPDISKPFPERYGVKHVRSCELLSQHYISGASVSHTGEVDSQESASDRKFIVKLDSVQYTLDHDLGQSHNNIYDQFNLLIRMRKEKSDYKTVMETIRDLLNSQTLIPSWLQDSFLGYGEASTLNIAKDINMHYMLHDAQHVIDSFPDYQVHFTETDPSKIVPPFRISFPVVDDEENNDEDGMKDEKPVLTVTPYSPGYRERLLNRQIVRLTTQQMKAIVSCLRKGLTLVSGPSGSGKKELSANIVSTLYLNSPKERTLIITRSSHALNSILEKVVDLGVDQGHVLRLGHNDEPSRKDDLSELGRTNFSLQLRLDLLKQAEQLAQSLGMSHLNVGATCENAGHFFHSKVVPLWSSFTKLVEQSESSDVVSKQFPFSQFFGSNITFQNDREQDIRLATECYQYLITIFNALSECRAFEVIRSPNDRANHLIKSHARIIGLTSDQAASRRRDLLFMDFHYDNIIIDEASQLLEIETMIPMLLQKSRALKRVVLLGDDKQLPPFIESKVLRVYSHLNQSLFSRLIRLRAAEPIYLDTQFKMRPSITELLTSQYHGLKSTVADNNLANAGLRYDFQLVNVPDFMNRGQSEVKPLYFQNLGEAEYMVAVYMYLRLIGYPNSSIALLATTKAQSLLIRDVLAKRCERIPLFGQPSKVSTIDEYQEFSSDLVLVSFVRTDLVNESGDVRDIRRLVSAISRARLGFYLFCRESTLIQCTELTPIYSQFVANGRPTQLQLVQNEEYGKHDRSLDSSPDQVLTIQSVEQMGQLVYEMTLSKVKELTEEGKEEEEASVQPGSGDANSGSSGMDVTEEEEAAPEAEETDQTSMQTGE